MVGVFSMKEIGSEKAKFARMNPPWKLGVAVKLVNGEKEGRRSIYSF